MKIVAACAWFEEPVDFLDRMVRSLAGHVDELVCLDGAWQGFDGGASSGREERDTIRAAALETDLPVEVRVPGQAWESQIEKRAALFRLAIAECGADWVLVVDGDVHVAHCDDHALRQSLALTDRDVATVTVTQMNQAWPYSEMPTNDVAQRHIYRGHPKLTVEMSHYGIRIGNRWLNGDASHVTLEPALDLSRVVRFAHDNQNRGHERNMKARKYRQSRRDRRLEMWR